MNEIRLINANDLKEDFADMREGYPIFSDTEMLSTKDIAKIIDDAPTVDKGYDFGYADGHGEGYELGKNSRPQGEFTRKELESWLYRIARNNLDNELGRSCEEIIGRLNGFERFVSDMRKGDV